MFASPAMLHVPFAPVVAPPPEEEDDDEDDEDDDDDAAPPSPGSPLEEPPSSPGSPLLLLVLLEPLDVSDAGSFPQAASAAETDSPRTTGARIRMHRERITSAAPEPHAPGHHPGPDRGMLADP